jgi:hypothetical protein
MSSAEIDSILLEAEGCAGGECALDEVSSLIASLQNQQSLLSKRVSEIDGLVASLEAANGRGGDDRPVDEMRETVKAIFRIFALGVSRCYFSRRPRPRRGLVTSRLVSRLCSVCAAAPPPPPHAHTVPRSLSLSQIYHSFPPPFSSSFFFFRHSLPSHQDKASGNNYPSLKSPMGYSGETKGGGKTAYDVLPPKPIKK